MWSIRKECKIEAYLLRYLDHAVKRQWFYMLIVDMNEIFICSDFQVGYMLDQSMCSMKARRVQGSLREMFKKIML